MMPTTGHRRERLTGLIRTHTPVSGSLHLFKTPGGNRLSRIIGGQSGQVTIIAALLMTVLLSFVALVVDTGAAYDKRRRLQNSADAAALAGAMEIAEKRGTGSADTIAKQYVLEDLGAGGAVKVGFPESTKVKVELEMEQPTFFARVFGVNSVRVGAKATAETVLADRVYNLMPMIVPRQRVDNHTGPENQAVFNLGDDRPLDTLSIMYEINGSRVLYTLTYVNTSNKSVALEMWSPVPAGAAYVDGSATSGGIPNGAEVRWTWAAMAAGDSRIVNFAVDFSGTVNPTNDVFASVDGGPAQKTSTSGPQKGYFWLTDFNSGSAGTPQLDDWIINGYPKSVGLGDLASGTGVRSSLKSAMDTRIVKDAKVVLPLYDYTEDGGRQGQYHVVGFAEFVITDFNFSGNPKSVTGYFTSGTVAAASASAGGGEPADYGIMAIRLSE